MQYSQKELKEMLKKAQENEIKQSFKLNEKQNITVKVGEKGTINIYGLQRFPICLYPNQLQTIASIMPQLQQFVEQNKETLEQNAKKAKEQKDVA